MLATGLSKSTTEIPPAEIEVETLGEIHFDIQHGSRNGIRNGF